VGDDECEWFINHTDGRVWSRAPEQQGYVATDTSAAPPNCGAPILWNRFGAWQVGKSTLGDFGIWRNGKPKLVISADGSVWANGGFLIAGNTGAPVSPGMVGHPVIPDRSLRGHNMPSGSVRMWDTSPLGGRVMYLESRQNCHPNGVARCGGDWLSFSGHSVKIYSSEASKEGIARPGDLAAPWQLHQIAGASDQYFIENRWHCLSGDQRCGSWLSVNPESNGTNTAVTLSSDRRINPAISGASIWRIHPTADRPDEVLLEVVGQCAEQMTGCARWVGAAAALAGADQHELILVTSKSEALQ
jgi:hypothetical protein